LGLILEGIRGFATGRPLSLRPRQNRSTQVDVRPSWVARLTGGLETLVGLSLLGHAPLNAVELYHRLARFYDPAREVWRRRIAGHVHDAFDQALAHYLTPNGQILDLGCGTGAALERLLALRLPFGTYTGVDLSPDMLARARQKFGYLPNVHFEQRDLISEPLPNGPFDLILSTWVLHLLRDPSDVVAKAEAQLRPGGHVILLLVSETAPWLTSLEQLALKPFGARPVPRRVYQRFPGLVSVDTSYGGALVLAVLEKQDDNALALFPRLRASGR
jgi:SAM-dependent methyltransferase